MSKKLGIITTIFCAVSLILSIVAMSIAIVKNNNSNQTTEAEEVQYVLYLGTNDKDTNLPVFTKEQAKEKAEEILLKHFGGYTIQEADGGWVDGEITYQEYTLVIYLSDTTLEKVHTAANEMITEFNQSSVLIQANKTSTEFYSGAN